MDLAYCGATFHGWQVQPGDVSVQQVLEEALGKALRTPVAVTGAGRTDAGVNARRMIAHFDAPEPVADAERLVRSLNALCGRDIAVRSITPVHAGAHARFDATSRTYRYFATTGKSAMLHRLAWQASPTLDFEAMNRAASMLLDTKDFASFAKLHSDVRTTLCRVTRAEWQPVAPGVMAFTITADRFLRNMVRAVVGTLADVGRHTLSLDGFARVIASRDRCAAGTSMPPHALYLWDVTYPYYQPPEPPGMPLM